MDRRLEAEYEGFAELHDGHRIWRLRSSLRRYREYDRATGTGGLISWSGSMVPVSEEDRSSPPPLSGGPFRVTVEEQEGQVLVTDTDPSTDPWKILVTGTGPAPF